MTALLFAFGGGYAWADLRLHRVMKLQGLPLPTVSHEPGLQVESSGALGSGGFRHELETSCIPGA
jgi:hypothetical protein